MPSCSHSSCICWFVHGNCLLKHKQSLFSYSHHKERTQKQIQHVFSAGAENESGDRSLAESLNLRAVRGAEPAAEKCKNTDKKSCKGKNRRSKNKKRKNGQKAAGKKNNKNKRNNKKRNKNKRKKNRKSSTSQRTEGSECLPKTCVDTGVGYMKKNDMVRNFEAQKKRLERFVKQANSKANKANNFAPLIIKLTALGGGNSSNLACNGNGTNSGGHPSEKLDCGIGKV